MKKNNRIVFFLLAFFLLSSGCHSHEDNPTSLYELWVGQHKLYVEVAATEDHRELGLMLRPSLPENHGMLFIYPQVQENLNFWMKDTRIPLSIAYANAQGKIFEIHDMQPLDETILSSQKPGKYALEVNQGWFQRHGIHPGDSLIFSKKISEIKVK